MPDLADIYHFYYRKHGRSLSTVHDQWKEAPESGHTPNEEWSFSHDRRRVSPLFSAVLDRSAHLTELLLHHGAHLNEHNREGRTVLQEAVILAHQDIVLLLLDRGANVEREILSDFLRGGTALHLAVTEGLVDIARSLLCYGADTQARTEVGWTAVDIAILDHQRTVLEVLLTSGMIAPAIQAPDIAVCAGQSVEDHDDQITVASHLLEHGVRGTECKHVIFFQCYLFEAIKKLDSSTTDTRELSALLIRDMETYLRKEAKVAGDITWPRNLCEACDRFENQDCHDIFKIYEHQQDFSSLESSSNNGCKLCHFFVESLNHHWCLLHQIDKKWVTEFGVSPLVRLRLGWREKFHEHELIVVCGDKIAFMDVDCVQRQLNTAVAETDPTDAKGTGSDRSLTVAKAWLQRCEDEHPSCQRSELGCLPNRVIDVGRVSGQPRIYVSDRERVPYAALSYCWGQHQNIRLLSTNIDEYTQRLPFALLPQTIADAISLARRMTVDYLWVDSLCILQDSETDLQQELSYMGDIFANTWFTIAAKDSSSCTSGLFHQRNWPTSAIVPTEIRLPSKTMQGEAGAHGRLINSRTSCFNRLMALPKHRVSSDGVGTPVLETRGWTLQESLLSRRMLSCGKHELGWNCLEGSCTERNPHEQDIRGRHKWEWAIKRVLVTGFANYGNLNRVKKEEIFNYWLEAVEDFLQRKLSDSRDTLAAVAGVQAEIGRILEDDPVAGVWAGQFFAPSLLWQIQDQHKHHLISSQHRPSWSWASASQPVKYVKHPSGTDNSRPWVWHHEVKYYPEVVSRNVDDGGLHGINGYLTIRCKILREADLDCERHVVKDFLNNPPRSQGKEAIHFETCHDFEVAAKILESWLMLVRTCQFIPGTKDRGYKYDIESHLLRLDRISPDRADFRRIGLVVTKSWANNWLANATEETVRLF